MNKPTLSKQLYKVFLICLRFTPITLAINFIASLICNYYKIYCFFFLYFGGVSFIFLGLLYLMSWVFQFCHLYRIPLHYVTICNIIGLTDKWTHYAINVLTLYRMYGIITGIALLLYVWFVYKNRDKNTIQHVKHLVDRMC